jgi:hypothetical protein
MHLPWKGPWFECPNLRIGCDSLASHLLPDYYSDLLDYEVFGIKVSTVDITKDNEIYDDIDVEDEVEIDDEIEVAPVPVPAETKVNNGKLQTFSYILLLRWMNWMGEMP